MSFRKERFFLPLALVLLTEKTALKRVMYFPVLALFMRTLFFKIVMTAGRVARRTNKIFLKGCKDEKIIFNNVFSVIGVLSRYIQRGNRRFSL